MNRIELQITIGVIAFFMIALVIAIICEKKCGNQSTNSSASIIDQSKVDTKDYYVSLTQCSDNYAEVRINKCSDNTVVAIASVTIGKDKRQILNFDSKMDPFVVAGIILDHTSADQEEDEVVINKLLVATNLMLFEER